MKNLIIILISVFIPLITFSQENFNLNLTSLSNLKSNQISQQKVESIEIISQLEKLSTAVKTGTEKIALNVVSGKTTDSYNLEKIEIANKLTLKVGGQRKVEHSYLVYRGGKKDNDDDFTTLILREDGQFYISRANEKTEIEIVKNVGGKVVDYKASVTPVFYDSDEQCLLTEDNVNEELDDDLIKRSSSFDGLFCIELGLASDYEFFQYKGYSVSSVESTLISRAASAANYYISCDMRVDLQLVDIVIETVNNSFFPIPKCIFNNSRIDAFVGNQVFALSSQKPDGDVVSLFSGSDLRGALCIGNIGGMANLINGACGYRNTNLVQYNHGGKTLAHEIGHNIGVGINHGNISGPYFYGSGTPWHPSTVSNVHDKMMDKSCIIKKDCDDSDSPNFTITTSCNNGNWSVTVTANDLDPANHWWGLMETDTQGEVSGANTVGQVGSPKSGISATFSWLDQSKRYYIKHGIWQDCCYSWREKRIPVPTFNTNPEFHFENASGTPKTAFCGGSDIYLDGTASTGENRFHLSAWRRPLGGGSFSWYGSIGWTYETVGVENLTDLFAANGIYFYEGYEYRIKLATMNLNECRVWTEKLKNFTVNCCYPYACRTAKREANEAGISLNVYPNPARDVVNIKLDQLVEGEVEVNLYAATGQLVRQQHFNGDATILEMPLEETPTGLYLVQVKHNNEVIHIQKLSIVK